MPASPNGPGPTPLACRGVSADQALTRAYFGAEVASEWIQFHGCPALFLKHAPSAIGVLRGPGADMSAPLCKASIAEEAGRIALSTILTGGRSLDREPVRDGRATIRA